MGFLLETSYFLFVFLFFITSFIDARPLDSNTDTGEESGQSEQDGQLVFLQTVSF